MLGNLGLMRTNTIMYRVAITAVGMKAAARAAKDDGPGDLNPGDVSGDKLGKAGVECRYVPTERRCCHGRWPRTPSVDPSRQARAEL